MRIEIGNLNGKSHVISVNMVHLDNTLQYERLRECHLAMLRVQLQGNCELYALLNFNNSLTYTNNFFKKLLSYRQRKGEEGCPKYSKRSPLHHLE